MPSPRAIRALPRSDGFLRKSSIDELPQIFNVLRGQLSLVGPRPHAVLAQTADRTYSDVVEGYFARHRVKPGVTGWAQINGWRGEIDNDEKIKFRTAFDLYYIENWSLWLDLKNPLPDADPASQHGKCLLSTPAATSRRGISPAGRCRCHPRLGDGDVRRFPVGILSSPNRRPMKSSWQR